MAKETMEEIYKDRFGSEEEEKIITDDDELTD